MSPRHAYRCYGLRVHSEVPLPSLHPAPADSGRPADVEIGWGTVPSALPGRRLDPRVTLDGTRALVETPEGRFLVAEDAVIMDVASVTITAAAADIRLCRVLTGLVLGVVLVLRGRPALHAAAAVVDGVAIAVAGPNGSGKSTLISRLVTVAGGALIGDDACVVRLSGDRVVVEVGPCWSKLDRAGLAVSGRGAGGLTPVADDEDRGRYYLPMTAAADDAPALAALYILRRGVRDIRRLRGVEAAQALVDAVHGRRLLPGSVKARDSVCTQLTVLDRVPVFVISVPDDLTAVAGSVDDLLRHLRGVVDEP